MTMMMMLRSSSTTCTADNKIPFRRRRRSILNSLCCGSCCLSSSSYLCFLQVVFLLLVVIGGGGGGVSAFTPKATIGTPLSLSSRRRSWLASTTTTFTTAVEDLTTAVDEDIDVNTSNVDSLLLPSSSSPSSMKLNRNGNRLELILVAEEGQQKQQEPIVLLDGVSSDVWTTTTPSSTSSSFSSVVLQTSVPSIAIQSFSLGNFLPSTTTTTTIVSKNDNDDDDVGSAPTDDKQQQEKSQYPHKWLAAARLNRYWMGPKFGGTSSSNTCSRTGGTTSSNTNDDASTTTTTTTTIPVDTQFFLIEIENPALHTNANSNSNSNTLLPYYAIMMPLVDSGYRSTLESSSSSIDDSNSSVKNNNNNNNNHGNDDQRLTLVSYSESGDTGSSSSSSSTTIKTTNAEMKMMNGMYIAIHDNPYELLSRSFQEVSDLLDGSFIPLTQKNIPTEFVNNFGWCTWDAFYSKVTPTGILEGVQSLNDAGIPVKNIILDDGWQSVSPESKSQSQQSDSSSSDEQNKDAATTKTLSSSLSLSGSSDVMTSSSSSSSSSSSAEVPTTNKNDRNNNSNTSIVDTIGNFISNIVSEARSFSSNLMNLFRPKQQHEKETILVSTNGTAAISIEKNNNNNNNLAAAAAAVTVTTTTAAVVIEKMTTALFSIIATTVIAVYQQYVEKSNYASYPSRIWTYLARNFVPLNAGLYKFFDSETDFGRQLNNFHPNSKFNTNTTTINEEKEEEEVEGDNDTNSRSSSDNNNNNTNMELKELVRTLKEDWNVNRVYCWHSLHGYWRGVSNELGQSINIDVKQIRTRASDHLLRIEPQMAFDPPSLFGVGLIEQEHDLTKFYKHLHDPLVDAGIDGVKVDVQSGVTAAGMSSDNDDGGGVPIAKLYTQAMEESVSKRFATSSGEAIECINCMCHSTENLYRYKTTSIARASDDFYPARPESHSVHLVNVAYNTLFVGEICLPDWDMFQSKHKSSELHAAARAIGGCPVYVSDKPGNHDIELLKKLVLPTGQILRAQLPGRPTRDCIFTDVGRDGISALKVWNINNRVDSGNDENDGGVIGAFNVQGVSWNFDTNENEILNASPPDVIASIKPYDVDSFRQNIHQGPFVIWSHRTKSLQVLPTGDSTIETVLQQNEWEIYTIQPVQQDKKSDIHWAPIGLGHMLNSGGALTDVGTLRTIDDVITKADISCRGPGTFVSYCQPRPFQVIIHHDDDDDDDDDTNGSSDYQHQLDFRYSKINGLLEFDLPPETNERAAAHHVTVVWEQ